MIVVVCSSLLVIIFVSIAVLHFYWAVGGRWAIEAVVPTNENGKPVLKTSVAACLVVGVGLFAFALYYLIAAGIIDFILSGFILTALGWLLPSIFFLRAIGDFNYVGFTKKIKGTTFARLDTLYFAPLCLLIALLGLVVQVVK
jgi:hypothetical protein